jgi:hypothetical protein
VQPGESINQRRHGRFDDVLRVRLGQRCVQRQRRLAGAQRGQRRADVAPKTHGIVVTFIK